MQAEELAQLKSWCSGGKAFKPTNDNLKELEQHIDKYKSLSKLFLGGSVVFAISAITFTASVITVGSLGVSLALYIIGGCFCYGTSYDFYRLKTSCEYFECVYSDFLSWNQKKIEKISRLKRSPSLMRRKNSRELKIRRENWNKWIDKGERQCGRVIIFKIN